MRYLLYSPSDASVILHEMPLLFSMRCDVATRAIVTKDAFFILYEMPL